ncbi:hypothetical protein ACQ27_gp518 [Klebsiella phage K64-1]|nr:hypothetical protein ACQ27_gp518 [Klebsiella phage K64-1]
MKRIFYNTLWYKKDPYPIKYL